jgi:hypothetical protein
MATVLGKGRVKAKEGHLCTVMDEECSGAHRQ